jgi:cell division cycle protein 37
MRRVVKQKYHIKSLLDLAEARASMNDCPLSIVSILTRPLPPRADKAHPRGLVTGFFRRLSDSSSVAAEYEKAGDELYTALVKRAGEKRKEREVEQLAAEQGGGEAVVLPREERLGPGGLDPVEVFASLPEPLQTAYEARDTEALRLFIDGCELQEAKRLMRLMVDSGLWVATPGEEGTLLKDD